MSRYHSESVTATAHSRQRRKIFIGAGLAVLIVLLLVGFFSFRDGGGGSQTGPIAIGPQRYFSNDDGTTWFADDANKLPPFMKDGKEAARAYVFRCADGKEFVAFLERLTPASKKKFDAITAQTGKPPDLMQADVVRPSDFEVKAPGQPRWLSQLDPRAATFMTPKCADGSSPQLLSP